MSAPITTYHNERYISILRILKMSASLYAVAVISSMTLGILGIGMIYDHSDSYTLGVMTRRLLIYGAIAAGAVVVIVKLVKRIRESVQPAPTKESSV